MYCLEIFVFFTTYSFFLFSRDLLDKQIVMEFLKKILGISDKFNDQVPKEKRIETIPQKTPVPRFLAEKFPYIFYRSIYRLI